MIDKEKNNCRISIRITPRQALELENICSVSGLTCSDIVKELLDGLLDRVRNPNSQRFFEFCDSLIVK